MTSAAVVLADVARALGRVLDIDPDVVRVDTPVADLGADDVALFAVVDLILSGHGAPHQRRLVYWPDPPERIRTVGDLVDLLSPVESANG